MKTKPPAIPLAGHKLTHQSKYGFVRHPGSYLAAKDLGVHRAHLHAVLSGKRQSHRLMARWQAWLKANPEFARANRKKTQDCKTQDAR